MTNLPRTPLSLLKTPRGLLALLGVCVTSLIVTYPLLSDSVLKLATDEEGNAIETGVVREAPFEHAILAKGEVDSHKKSTLISEVDDSTRILWLAPAGEDVAAPLCSPVNGIVKTIRHPNRKLSVIVVESEEGDRQTYQFHKQTQLSAVVVTPGERVRKKQILAGDVVCRLDSSELEKSEQKYEIRVNDYRALFDKAVKDVEIRQVLNESNNSQAELKAQLAELDLQKYLKGSYPQQIEKLEGEIQSSREDLTRAREAYEFSERMAFKGYKDLDEVEKARLKVMKLEFAVKNQEKSREVLQDFSHERTLLQLRETALHLKRHAKRVKLAGEASMAQYRVLRASRERVYNIYKQRLDWIREQIKACTLVAPQAGKVVIATSGSSRSPTVLEEGLSVRERQKILYLPDLSDMKVEARIHESMISHVREGLEAKVVIDSLPQDVLECKLTSLSTLPVPGRYPNYDQRDYIAEFRIEIPDHLEGELRPGMMAEVEILANKIEEPVIQVPMNAVIQTGSKYFAWIPFGESVLRREITVSLSNDESFVVRDGLLEGEQVVLNPHVHFPIEVAGLRNQHPDPIQANPNWKSEERVEEETLPQSEEEFFEMIGYLEKEEVTEPEVDFSVRKPVASTSSIGD